MASVSRLVRSLFDSEPIRGLLLAENRCTWPPYRPVAYNVFPSSTSRQLVLEQEHFLHLPPPHHPLNEKNGEKNMFFKEIVSGILRIHGLVRFFFQTDVFLSALDAPRMVQFSFLNKFLSVITSSQKEKHEKNNPLVGEGCLIGIRNQY